MHLRGCYNSAVAHAEPLPSATPPMQLRLLDRLAGTTAAADRLAACLADWLRAAAQVGMSHVLYLSTIA